VPLIKDSFPKRFGKKIERSNPYEKTIGHGVCTGYGAVIYWHRLRPGANHGESVAPLER
jgi:hypothetical protein